MFSDIDVISEGVEFFSEQLPWSLEDKEEVAHADVASNAVESSGATAFSMWFDKLKRPSMAMESSMLIVSVDELCSKSSFSYAIVISTFACCCRAIISCGLSTRGTSYFLY